VLVGLAYIGLRLRRPKTADHYYLWRERLFAALDPLSKIGQSRFDRPSGSALARCSFVFLCVHCRIVFAADKITGDRDVL